MFTVAILIVLSLFAAITRKTARDGNGKWRGTPAQFSLGLLVWVVIIYAAWRLTTTSVTLWPAKKSLF